MNLKDYQEAGQEEFHNQSHARNMQAIKLFRLTCGIAILVPVAITIIYLIVR